MERASDFAGILRRMRTDAGYTQTQIAKMLNIHRTTYTKYEKDHTPGVEVLVRLSEIYNMTVDEMFSLVEGNDISSRVRLGAPSSADSGNAKLIRLSSDELRLLGIYRESNCKKKIIDAARRLSSEAELEKKD